MYDLSREYIPKSQRKVSKTSSENLAWLKYLGKALTSQSHVHEEQKTYKTRNEL